MKRIGINGHLADAVCKTRVLVGEPISSVEVILTPHCEPLKGWMESLRPVGWVTIDRDAVSRDGWGEYTEWSLPVDYDTSYRVYPNEWIINFIGRAAGLAPIPFESWFGVWKPAEPVGTNRNPRSVFIGSVRNPQLLESMLHEEFHGLHIERWQSEKDILENLRRAAECEVRVVPPDMQAHLLSTLGLTFLVDISGGWSASLWRLFGPPGGYAVTGETMIDRIRHGLIRHGDLESSAATSAVPCGLTIGIPTICCGDLLAASVKSLLPQLQDVDRVVIIDNGKQDLQGLVTEPRIKIIEAESNLGVAGSWNCLVREALFTKQPAEWLLLLNDDIELGGDQLQHIRTSLRMHQQEGRWLIVGPYFWSVVAINRACVEQVGYFDENFFPAYFEDNDYHRRLNGVDYQRYASDAVFDPAVKRNSETLARRPDLNRFVKNREYYIQKWGGLPGAETFLKPFQGVSE